MLSFTHSTLRDFLLTKGVPSINWHIQDWKLGTVSDDYVRDVWQEWINALKLNAPELLVTREVNGKSKLVPLWVEEAGDCENHAVLMFGHAIIGNWKHAVAGGPKVGRVLGYTFYNTVGVPAYGIPAGGHCINWHVNHEGEFKTFEPALGEFVEWQPQERASAYFGTCA